MKDSQIYQNQIHSVFFVEFLIYLCSMTQVILNNIRNKKDLPFLKKLSKNIGWTISGQDTPNAETIAAMREAESETELEDFDLDGFHKMVASL